MITLKNFIAIPLRLWQYAVTVNYRPGKEMQLVAALSCLPSPCNQDTLKLDVRIDHHDFMTSRLLTAEDRNSPGPCTVSCLQIHTG